MYLTESDPTHNCSVSIAPIVPTGDTSAEALNQEPMKSRLSENTPPLIDKKRMVGRYLLKRCLGRGTAGSVWSAEDIEYIGRDVALKLMHADVHDEHALARYSCEVRALVRMDDPHIARIWEHGKTADGKLYISMELVQGPQLTKYCETCNPTIEERIQLVIKMCRGLQHAHQRGILHRDLKPANVLVSQQDAEAVPKIIDFGLAKSIYQPLIPGAVDTTQMGCLLGTIGYMSPEQASTGQRDVDTRSDVYSLVVILYELLTGSLPIPRAELNRATLSQALDMIQNREVEAASWRVKNHADAEKHARHSHQTPAKLSQMLQGDLDAILEKGLSKDPDARYQSAGELAEDLERYLKGDVVQARQRTLWYLTQKMVKRHWRQALLVGGLVLLFLISWVVIAVSWRSAEQARTRAEALNDLLKKAYGKEQLLRTDAEKSSEFLEKTFGISLPSGKGSDVKLVEALEESSKLIDSSFPDQPRAKMMVRLVLGRSFLRLNRPKAAIDVIEQVMDVGDDAFEDAASLRWSAASVEIQALMQLKYWEQAEARCKQWLMAEKKPQNKEQWSQFRSFMRAYARLLMKQKRFGEASQLLEKLELEIKQGAPAYDLDLWTIRGEQASLYVEWSQQDSSMLSPASQLVKSYLQESEQLESDHVMVIQLRSTYARLLKMEKRYDEASEVLESLLFDVEKKHGDSHYYAQIVLSNLAKIYELAGKRRQTRATLVKLLELQSKTLGPDHEVTLFTRSELMRIYKQYGNDWHALQQAFLWYQGSLKTLNENNPEIKHIKRNISQLLHRCGLQWMIWQAFNIAPND